MAEVKQYIHVEWELTMEGDIPFTEDFYPGLSLEEAVGKEMYAERSEVLEFFSDGVFDMKIRAKPIEIEVSKE